MAKSLIHKKSEFRQDPVSKEWVVVASRRAFRPHEVKSQKPKRVPKNRCPFEDPQASGHKDPMLLVDRRGNAITGTAVRKALLGRDWFLQIIPNKFPIVEGAKCGIERRKGIFVFQPGAGFHEVVVFRDHDRDPSQFSHEELSFMILGYQERYRMLSNEDCAEYILIFHNHGPAAGASIYHPHSQIVALPVIPPDVGRSIFGSRQYYETHRTCVHCRMIQEEKKSRLRLVYENEEMIVLCPFASKVSFEMRIFPKRHEYAFEHIEKRQRECLAEALGVALRKMARVLKSPSYNFFIHTAPTQPEYFSYYHWHVEILPRTSIWAGVELGTGIEVVSVLPEEAARHLRSVAIKL
jgi:UDPglucose--hexose-1-phosphate uridylyltransferase